MQMHQAVLAFILLIAGCSPAREQEQVCYTSSDEAINGAYLFLSTAEIKTNEYEMASPERISADRLKGWKVWRLEWRRKENISNNQKGLVVLAFENGSFACEIPYSGICKEGTTNAYRIRRF
jgi:hypothetical protein